MIGSGGPASPVNLILPTSIALRLNFSFLQYREGQIHEHLLDIEPGGLAFSEVGLIPVKNGRGHTTLEAGHFGPDMAHQSEMKSI